ncbi:MAG: hypothetical protein AAFX09_07445 [Pseudomonadota bacterium]
MFDIQSLSAISGFFLEAITTLVFAPILENALLLAIVYLLRRPGLIYMSAPLAFIVGYFLHGSGLTGMDAGLNFAAYALVITFFQTRVGWRRAYFYSVAMHVGANIVSLLV